MMPDLLHYTALILKQRGMDYSFMWGGTQASLAAAVSMAQHAVDSQLSDHQAKAVAEAEWSKTVEAYCKKQQDSLFLSIDKAWTGYGLPRPNGLASMVDRYYKPQHRSQHTIIMDDPGKPAATSPSTPTPSTSQIDWSTIDRLVKQAGQTAAAMAERERLLLEKLNTRWIGKSVALVRLLLGTNSILVVEHPAPATDPDRLTVVVRTKAARIVEVLSVVAPPTNPERLP